MQFGGHLIFEGKNGLQWISTDKETGLVEVQFENDDGNDVTLSFDPQALKDIIESAEEFFEKGKTDRPIHKGTCIIKPDVLLCMDEEDVSISVDWDHPGDENPIIMIAGKRYGKVEVVFNIRQVQAIAQCCQKILGIRESLNGLKKNEIISAKTESA